MMRFSRTTSINIFISSDSIFMQFEITRQTSATILCIKFPTKPSADFEQLLADIWTDKRVHQMKAISATYL